LSCAWATALGTQNAKLKTAADKYVFIFSPSIMVYARRAVKSIPGWVFP
jgi:hypothetical protein